MNKILFILKRREDYSHTLHYSHLGLSTGLFNSAMFVCDMLNSIGIEAVLEVAIDNNCIDKLVTLHKPSHVIIEALWVVPEKFEILNKLHPDVTWMIRLHSETPFIANEGMAMNWLGKYLDYPKVKIAINAPRMLNEIKQYLEIKYGKNFVRDKLVYLPNFYPQEYKLKNFDKNKEHIDIGCFGAVRPLKNHLLQAISALAFADSIGKKLKFHINAGRIEMKGEPVLHNLIALFENLSHKGHELVHHHWTPRQEFIQLCSEMDIGMQVSFSETFNIVGADFISQGVPFVASKEIPWSNDLFNADPTQMSEIKETLRKTYNLNNLNVFLNQFGLKKYTDKTKIIWKNYFK